MVLSGLTFQRVISRAVFALLSLLSITCLRAQPNGIAGTMPEDVLPELKEILRTALQQSPQVFLAAIDLERGEAARIQANSFRWPNLGASFNYANNQEAISGNTSTESRASGLFYSISLGQSLFHWGALKNQSAIGRISLLIAEKNYAEAYRALAVTLRQSYLELVMKKARLRHARHAFKRAESDLDVLKRNASQVSPSLISGRELDLREARLELDRVEAEFTAGRRKLARFAGLAELPEDKIADELPKPAYVPALASSITAMV
ncbi:MAG: TolC family protein, partial [Opitutaceae bacterium]